MPQLIVDDVPREIYERLEKRAVAECRSVREQTIILLERVLRDVPDPSPRLLEYIPNEEISAPFELPRVSKPVRVEAVAAKKPRLPDFLFDGPETPE